MIYILPIIFLISISFFGTFAGSDNTSKLWRRAFIPISFFILAYVTTKNLFSFLILFQYFIFGKGHGTPSSYNVLDITGLHKITDKGSKIGRFFYKIFKGNLYWTNVFTRGTLALLNCLCFLGVKKSWKEYILCSLMIILTFAFIQWRNWGSINIKNKIFLPYVDLICYLIFGICGFLIIV